MRFSGLKKTETLLASRFTPGVDKMISSVAADVPVPEGRVGSLLGALPGATADSLPPAEVLGGIGTSAAPMVLIVPVSNSCLLNSITKRTKLETTAGQDKGKSQCK